MSTLSTLGVKMNEKSNEIKRCSRGHIFLGILQGVQDAQGVQHAQGEIKMSTLE
jgi:hypothetical protein